MSDYLKRLMDERHRLGLDKLHGVIHANVVHSPSCPMHNRVEIDRRPCDCDPDIEFFDDNGERLGGP